MHPNQPPTTPEQPEIPHPPPNAGQPSPGEPGEEERLRVCLAALAESARRLRDELDGRPLDKESIDAFYKRDANYAMRSEIDDLFSSDRADLVKLAIEAGFPIEAPTAFAHGSLLCGAAYIGAPRCARMLASLGADIDAVNNGGQTPIELACEAAGERAELVETVKALVEAGAAIGLAQRQAAKLSRLPGDRARKPGRIDQFCGPEAAERTRPLGREALACLGRDWHHIENWAGMQGQEPSAGPDAARRLRALRDALGQTDEEFLGDSLAYCLARYELPASIEAAWVAQEEQAGLLRLGLPASAQAPRRAL